MRALAANDRDVEIFTRRFSPRFDLIHHFRHRGGRAVRRLRRLYDVLFAVSNALYDRLRDVRSELPVVDESVSVGSVHRFRFLRPLGEPLFRLPIRRPVAILSDDPGQS